jgi:hypothetical protein
MEWVSARSDGRDGRRPPLQEPPAERKVLRPKRASMKAPADISLGQDHDPTCAESLIEAVDPSALIADKAFDADAFIFNKLKHFRAIVTRYRERNLIERLRDDGGRLRRLTRIGLYRVEVDHVGVGACPAGAVCPEKALDRIGHDTSANAERARREASEPAAFPRGGVASLERRLSQRTCDLFE